MKETSQKKPKKVPKASSVTKKVPAKKTVTAKRTPLKRVAKKTTSSASKKKALPKRVVRKPVKKTVAKVVKPTKTTTKETIVKLPEKMSAKAIIRSNKLRIQLDRYIHESVYKVAYVSAYCFLFVGGAFALSGLSDTPLPTSFNQAEVISSLSNSTNVSTISNQTTATFSFLTVIKAQIQAPMSVNFTAANFRELKLELHQTGGVAIPLNYQQVVADKYEVDIPADINPGYYELRAYLKSQGTNNAQVISSREFFIGTPEQEREFNTPAVTQEPIAEPKTDAENTIVATEAETKPVTDTIERERNIESVPVRRETPPATPSFTITATPVGQTAITAPPTVAPDEPAVFALVPQANTISGAASIWVNLPDGLTFSELYYRPLNSLEYRFLTLASERNGNWTFIFDSRNIPNGRYEFVARSTQNRIEVQTKSVIFTIDNTVAVTITAETVPERNEESIEVRDFLAVGDVPFENPETLSREVSDIVNQLLQENESTLNDLLRRYAAALQSGDEMLIAAAKAQLIKKRESIVTDTLQDENKRFFSDDIDVQLQQRVDVLIARSSTFEQLRTERSSGASSIDTDQDGISDFDEQFLYNTDPNQADTDNDGISDGVEIVQGFNPTDPSTEAVISFESPKETVGLERTDVLEVTATPVITPNVESGMVETRTEIRGRALPNSFVTLFIFSNPTIVTIKTGDDGSFIYTFEKELEDGRHDVFVAVTDNAGAIIAQSNPFSFIKEAQAFTPVDAQAAESVTTNTVTDSGNDDYVTVVGVAILALGIILLMLGIGLRRKNEDIDLLTLRGDDYSDSKILTDKKVSAPQDNSATDKS